MWVLAFTVTGDHYFSSRFISRSSSTRMKESSYLGQAKKHGKWPLSLRSCSRYFQRSHPASVHSHFPATWPKSQQSGLHFFVEGLSLAGGPALHWVPVWLRRSISMYPATVTALITHSVSYLPYSVSGPHSPSSVSWDHIWKKQKNYHIFILEPFKARGMERSDWASQDLAPPLWPGPGANSTQNTWNTDGGNFPKEILGVKLPK